MKTVLLFGTLFVLLFLAACSPAATPTPAPTATPNPPTATVAPPAWPQTFTDGLGREVQLDAPPEAIVTLGASLLESLFAMDAGDLIVGRDDTSTYPEAALEITDIGSLFGELPAETIVALEPDLILAPEIISQEQIATLEELGLTVYYQTNPTDFEGLYANLLDLGHLTDHTEEAETLVASLETRVEAALAGVESMETEPKVFYELDATDPQSPWTSGAGTFIDTAIAMAGGGNIGAALEGEYAQISSEELLAQDPDVILLSDALYGVTVESVAARSGWDSLTAVKEGRIFPFDPFLLSVPGPRLVDGLEEMVRLIHMDDGS